INVELLQLVQIVEILSRDFGDGDVVDGDFLLADQIQQEVERAFVDFVELDSVGCGQASSPSPPAFLPRTRSRSSPRAPRRKRPRAHAAWSCPRPCAPSWSPPCRFRSRTP